ncbi:MAG: hypothetical protein K2P70_04715 [Hyphomonadaceae bacterium]|nr:hypothetical protein [Hyphomonadaceae bacterium]
MKHQSNRRNVLSASLAFLAGLAPASRALAQDNGSDWESYLAATRQEALELIRGNRDDVAGYLHWISSRLAARTDVPSAPLQPVGWADPAILFGTHPPAAPFVLIEFRLAPGAYLPPHNHPNASVSTLLLEGEATIDNYELDPDSDPPGLRGEARLRHTVTQMLRPGDCNFVQPVRNNLHAFRAGPHGARGIDITTQHGPSGAFGYLKLLEPRSVGATLRAEWVNPAQERLAP